MTAAPPLDRDRLRHSPKALMLLMLLLAVLVALGLRGQPLNSAEGVEGRGDAALYRDVAREVASGASYYEAMPQALRARHYPLRPFVTVRPPLLTWTQAALGEAAARALLIALAAAAFAAWAWRLHGLRRDPILYAVALLGLASGLAPALVASAPPFHEIWAGVLIALALALRSPRRWGPSVVLGLIAALIRELAAPFLVAMATVAFLEGGRREALGWIGALLAVAAALAVHAFAVAGAVAPNDPASASWVALGGWTFLMQTASWNALADAGPPWLLAALLPAALMGLMAWRDDIGRRLTLTVFGYWAAFLLVGRPDNAYWGLLIAPLWPLGWAGFAAIMAANIAPVQSRTA